MDKVYFYYTYLPLDINETSQYTIATRDSSDVALNPIQSAQFYSLEQALKERELSVGHGFRCSPVIEGWA
jgi:hypothetical protein